MKKKIYALLYGRLGEGYDPKISDQLRQCRKFAKAEGYIVEKGSSFKDIYTGPIIHTERQGLLGILDHIDKFPERKFVVIVNDISFIGRDKNVIDSYCEALCLRGVSIEFADPTTERDIKSQAEMALKQVVNRYENVAKRVRTIMIYSRKSSDE